MRPSPIRSNDWQPATATIRKCRTSWSETSSEGGPQQYVVTFSYEVRGRTYRGWYYAGTRHEPGETLHILYDPLHPEKNTGSEHQGPLWARVLAWILGSVLAILLIRFGPKLR
jgi:hypothetical protein